jgi:eukaryotic-like serine/threonine-protein kinase
VGVHENLQETEGSPAIPFGPFLLLHKIAAGGSAEVFLARSRNEPLLPPFVVKRLLPSLRAKGDINVLDREAELHRLVQHQNVVKVLQAGKVDGEPYIAMEYVDGLDLYRLLQRSSSGRQPIPPTLAVHIARNLADALYAVHTAKQANGNGPAMIHGDVSPSNIYLGADGSVKLGDFGIARLATQKEVEGEPVRAAGHFGYLAPEQLTGEAQDERVDVFALGVVLGELLHGARVFPGSGQLAVMLSIRDANIAPLRSSAPNLPPGLFEVCERALLREPEARYPSALEFSRALQPFELPDAATLQRSLSSWVNWAKDGTRFVQELEQRVRESVNVMKAVSRSSGAMKAVRDPRNPAPAETSGTLTADQSAVARLSGTGLAGQGSPSASQLEAAKALLKTTEDSQVRRTGTSEVETVPFSKLLEMVATGELKLSDEVALWGAPFQPVERIEELAKHLVPSTTQTTSRMFGPGLPDYVADFLDVPMLHVLGKIHNEKRTCSLFVTQSLKYREQRKDVYIRDGRLLHVTSTDPDELLGRYLVHHNIVTEEQLELALAELGKSHKQLGELLIGLGIVDAVDVFTALRNQGRDRIAALCGWKRGNAQLYPGAAPERMLFPLDLDLTLCMMAGALRNGLAPPEDVRIVPGARAPAPGEKAGCIPLLNLVPMVARKRTTSNQALLELIPLSKRKDEQEARAVLVVAEALEWIRFD